MGLTNVEDAVLEVSVLAALYLRRVLRRVYGQLTAVSRPCCFAERLLKQIILHDDAYIHLLRMRDQPNFPQKILAAAPAVSEAKMPSAAGKTCCGHRRGRSTMLWGPSTARRYPSYARLQVGLNRPLKKSAVAPFVPV